LGDEFVAHQLNIINGEKGLSDVPLGHITAEAIGTQQPPIAWLGVNHVGVNFWFRVNIAEDAHEDTASGVDGGLFRGDAATVHKALHKRVVARDLFENTLSKSINPGVTDVGDDHLRTDSNHRAHRGSHARELGVLFNRGGKLAPGLQNVGKEGLPGFINTRVGPIQTREVLNREGTGNVTAGMTTHAIRDHKEVSPD
jgi:hypothetical protein